MIAAAEDEKENVDDKGKKPMREEDLPQEQAEGEEEAGDSPGSRTDMELAWENLEVAKYIYEHEPHGNHAKELAGTLPYWAMCNQERASPVRDPHSNTVHESFMCSTPSPREMGSSDLQPDASCATLPDLVKQRQVCHQSGCMLLYAL